MPHSTSAYAFEWKVSGFARHLAERWMGGAEARRFVIVLDESGSVRTVHFDCPGDAWHELLDRLDGDGSPWVFHDPFAAPEYTWLGWRRIDRSTMEHLVGIRFEDADFAKSRPATSRAPDLDPPGEFPKCWGVMF